MSLRPPTRLFLCLAIWILGVPTQAEALRGIPADVDAALHISYDVAAKSQLHPLAVSLQKRMEKIAEQLDPAASQRNKELLDRLGLKPNGNHRMDIGLRIKKGESEEEPQYAFYCVAQIDLRKAAFDSFAKEQGVGPVAAGDLSGWECNKLLGTLLKVLTPDDQSPSGMDEVLQSALQDYAVIMPEDNVILLSPIRDLNTVMNCWRKQKPSFELPAQAQTVVKATPLPHTQFYANLRKIQEIIEPESVKTDKSGIKDIVYVVGEDAKDFLMRAKVGFTDEAKAKTAAQEITSALAIGNLATAETDEDDAETQYFKGEASAFLSGISAKQEGATVNLQSTYALERAKVLFGKLGDKVEQLAREAAVEKNTPAPTNTEEEEMDAPAKSPAPKKTK